MKVRLAVSALAVLLSTSAAQADLMILDAVRKEWGPTQGGTHPDNATVFTLTFNQAPDFLTLDSGNQINSFIGYIGTGVPNADPRDPSQTIRLIRGDLIAANGNMIAVETGTGDPPAGTQTALVSYQIAGNVVTFTVPNPAINDGPAIGTARHFAIDVYDHGNFTSTAGFLVPEPSSVALIAIGATLLGGYAWKRKRKAA